MGFWAVSGPQLPIPLFNAVSGLTHHAAQKRRDEWLLRTVHRYEAELATNKRLPVLVRTFLAVELKSQSTEDVLDLFAGERPVLAPHPALGGLRLEWLLVAPQHSASSVKSLEKHGQLEQGPVGKRGATAEKPACVGPSVHD